MPCLALFSCIKWSPLLKINSVYKGRVHAALFNFHNDRVREVKCAVVWYAGLRERLVTLHLVFPIKTAVSFGWRKYVPYYLSDHTP